MAKNNKKATDTVATNKKGVTPNQAKTHKEAKERKKAVIAANEAKPKTYSVMAGYDPNLKTEVEANLREAGFSNFFSTDTYLYIKNVSAEDVERLREVLRNTKFEYKKSKKNIKGEVIQVVTRTLSVHYMNAFNGEKLATLIGNSVRRERKPTNNTTVVRIAAKTARKETNKTKFPKGKKYDDKQNAKSTTSRRSIKMRGTHSSGTNRTTTQRKIAKRVALALKHIEKHNAAA